MPDVMTTFWFLCLASALITGAALLKNSVDLRINGQVFAGLPMKGLAVHFDKFSQYTLPSRVLLCPNKHWPEGNKDEVMRGYMSMVASDDVDYHHILPSKVLLCPENSQPGNKDTSCWLYLNNECLSYGYCDTVSQHILP